MIYVHELGKIFKTKTEEEKDKILDELLNTSCENFDCEICPFYSSKVKCRVVDESKRYYIGKLKEDINYNCDFYATKYFMTMSSSVLEKLKYKIIHSECGYWCRGFENMICDIFNLTDYMWKMEAFFGKESVITQNIEVRDYYNEKLIALVYKGVIIAVNNTEETYVLDKPNYNKFVIDVIAYQLENEEYGNNTFYEKEQIKVVDNLDEDMYLEIENNNIVERPKSIYELKLADYKEEENK